MTRIDMSEYSEKHTVSRLIGAPPGYVGYEEGGTLTESVRRRPYQILLLDEFEKGHKDVWNILLQLFDDGHLTDSHGRQVSFRNVIVVMTSNMGANVIADLPPELTGSEPNVRDALMEVVRGTLSPELLNRIDETVVFNRLQRENMGQIASIHLDEISKRLKDGQSMILDVSAAAKESIAEKVRTRLPCDPLFYFTSLPLTSTCPFTCSYSTLQLIGLRCEVWCETIEKGPCSRYFEPIE